MKLYDYFRSSAAYRVRIALKHLQHPDPGALARFKQEFRAFAGVEHPNLVRLHELPEQSALHDVVFRWIQVGTLKVDAAFWLDPLSSVMVLVADGLTFVRRR